MEYRYINLIPNEYDYFRLQFTSQEEKQCLETGCK